MGAPATGGQTLLAFLALANRRIDRNSTCQPGAECRHAVRDALEVSPSRLLNEATTESRNDNNRRGVGQVHGVE